MLSGVTLDDEGVDGQALFDEVVEAYGEHPVVISMPGHPERNIPDFDYPYYVQVVSPELSEAALLSTGEYDNAPDYLKLSVTDGGEHLEMYDLDTEHGSTFIGNVFQVRPRR